MRWEGVATNIEKRHVEMDLHVLAIKKRSYSFEEFLKQVEEIMIVSFPEIFKRCYWDKDFEEEVLINAEYLFSKNQLEVFYEIINSC